MPKTKETYKDAEDGEILVDERARVWSTIIYPGDSAPGNWYDILDSFHISIAVSPLHTGEALQDGGTEKDHRHVILAFCGQKSFSQVKLLLAPLCGLRPMVVPDIRGYTRYLIHLDSPTKKQYSKSEIITFGNFDLETNLLPSKAYRDNLAIAIEEWIEKNDCCEYWDLVRYCTASEPCWRDVVVNQMSGHFKALLQSRRNKQKDAKQVEDLRRENLHMQQMNKALLQELRNMQANIDILKRNLH